MRITTTLSSFINRALPPESPTRQCLTIALDALDKADEFIQATAQKAYRSVNTNHYTRAAFFLTIAGIGLVTFYLFRKKAQQPPFPQLELEPSSPPSLPSLPAKAPLPAAPLPSPLPVVKEPIAPAKPTIVADISIHTDQAQGTVEQDKKFGFGQRLKDIHKNPIQVNAWDQYIPLWHNTTIPRIKDLKGSLELFTLPSCVFELANDNLLEFYLDDQLYRLTLVNHCMEDTPFDVALAAAVENPEWGNIYPEDVVGLQCLFNLVIHESRKITPWSPEKIDYEAIKRDQAPPMKYVKLLPDTVLRYSTLEGKYHVYEVDTMKGTYVVLIIPHNRSILQELNKNRISESHSVGHNRPQTYYYGQYYTIPKTHRVAAISIEFDTQGYLQIRQTNKPDPIVATIGINMTSWAIDDDQKFQFGKRLTLVDGTPVAVKPTDRYISFWCGLQIKDAQGNFADPVLPSSLLEGVKEGDTHEFYLDDQLYELTFEQNDPPFEVAFQRAMEAQFCPLYYPEDVVGKIQLCGQVIHKYKAITDTALTKNTPDVLDMAFYQQDQKDNGTYQVLGHGSAGWEYDFRLSDSLKNGVHVYQIENSKGRFFLTLIPHHLQSREKASRVKGSPHSIDNNNSFYHHGRYCLIYLPHNTETYTVGFNSDGFLNFTPVLKS